MAENLTPEDERRLEQLGFERRYLLIGHPGWPDPLRIWPPTEEHARTVYEQNPHPDAYVELRWGGGPETVVLPPSRTTG